MTAAIQSGGRAASATIKPSMAADTAMPISTPGSGTPSDAEHAADRHHQRKHDRQDEDRGRAEERAPQPDRHHRRDVIGPEQRMREAADEAAGHAAGMRQRRAMVARIHSRAGAAKKSRITQRIPCRAL